jgi:hypothetical protein
MVEKGVAYPDHMVKYATKYVDNGMSKKLRQATMKGSPLPEDDGLKAKKVDKYVKKLFTSKSLNFSDKIDRRQLNVGARILDPLGPLLCLWQESAKASKLGTSLDPSSVAEAAQRAISLLGNAAFCLAQDRRRGIITKLAPDSLDTLDEDKVFAGCGNKLFGEKFKKKMVKNVKDSREMHEAMGIRPRSTKSSFFRGKPGSGPGQSSFTQGYSTGWNNNNGRSNINYGQYKSMQRGGFQSQPQFRPSRPRFSSPYSQTEKPRFQGQQSFRGQQRPQGPRFPG